MLILGIVEKFEISPNILKKQLFKPRKYDLRGQKRIVISRFLALYNNKKVSFFRDSGLMSETI